MVEALLSLFFFSSRLCSHIAPIALLVFLTHLGPTHNHTTQPLHHNNHNTTTHDTRHTWGLVVWVWRTGGRSSRGSTRWSSSRSCCDGSSSTSWGTTRTPAAPTPSSTSWTPTLTASALYLLLLLLQPLPLPLRYSLHVQHHHLLLLRHPRHLLEEAREQDQKISKRPW